MKRLFDFFTALVALIALSPLMLALAVLVKLTSKGPVLYWSDRVGRNNSIFRMPKLRTMRIDTPQVATHLLQDANEWMTPPGRFLRSTSLDELPQLWNVLNGEMSLVGPRPALFNQDDLISLRTTVGVEKLTPGVTGWAQINGRDELAIPIKVRFDEFYLENRSFLLDLRILCLTGWKVLRRDGIQQALPFDPATPQAESGPARTKKAA